MSRCGCDRRERARLSGNSRHLRGAKGDKTGWSAVLKHLKECGLKSVRLITSDACIGLAESAAGFFLKAAWQRCVVHTLQPRALDQGAGDRGHAQGNPRQRGPRGSTQEGQPSEAAGLRAGTMFTPDP
jgi:Transposase, Mutator family